MSRYSGAGAGDRTMLDAVLPAVQALDAHSGESHLMVPRLTSSLGGSARSQRWNNASAAVPKRPEPSALGVTVTVPTITCARCLAAALCCSSAVNALQDASSRCYLSIVVLAQAKALSRRRQLLRRLLALEPRRRGAWQRQPAGPAMCPMHRLRTIQTPVL